MSQVVIKPQLGTVPRLQGNHYWEMRHLYSDPTVLLGSGINSCTACSLHFIVVSQCPILVNRSNDPPIAYRPTLARMIHQSVYKLLCATIYIQTNCRHGASSLRLLFTY